MIVVASLRLPTRPSRTLSPSSRGLARRSLVGCLLLIISLSQWGVIEHHDDLPSRYTERWTRLTVVAFQHQHPWQSRPRRSPSPPSVQTSLGFSDKDDDIITTINGRRRRSETRYRVPRHYRRRFCNRNSSCTPLFGGGSNAGDSSNKSNGDKKRSPSMKRIGGRGRRQKPSRNDDDTALDNSSSSSSIVDVIKNDLQFPSAGFLVTALLVLTLLKNLVFGGGGDSDFYYYSYSSSSSSVYETRINPDGSRTTTETSRQESSDLKTNIPGLTGRDVIDRGSTNYFDFDFDDE